ncbi:hypothetical protein BC567DRAFT_27022 [Phyllosticta citribraziliensis]
MCDTTRRTAIELLRAVLDQGAARTVAPAGGCICWFSRFFVFFSSTTGHARLGSRGCMRTAVSHSPTQGTRLLLSPCVPFTPLYFAPPNLPGSGKATPASTPSPVSPRVAGPAVGYSSVPLAWYSVGQLRRRGHLADCLLACLSLSICFLTPQDQVVIVLAVRPPTAKSSSLRNHPKGGTYMRPPLVDPACRYACVPFVRSSVSLVHSPARDWLRRPVSFVSSLPLLSQQSLSPRSVRRPLARAWSPRYEMRDARPTCFLQRSTALYDTRSSGYCAAKSGHPTLSLLSLFHLVPPPRCAESKLRVRKIPGTERPRA